MDIVSLLLAKKYTDASLAGGGAVKGKNCTVKSIEEIAGGHRLTFQWTLDSGTVQTGSLDVMDGKDGRDGINGRDGTNGTNGRDGVGIASLSIDGDNHLIVTLTDGTPVDAGLLPVAPGGDAAAIPLSEIDEMWGE